jgi:DNA polymerase III epsilon subunit-like protein
MLLSKMHLLFIDTETNGLPLNKYAAYTSTEMWPHIIQISWQIVDSKTWQVVSEEDHFLKLRTQWNKDAERVHQIPESIARNFGKEPLEVLKKLHADLSTCSYVVGHNLSFDKTVIMSEIQRLYEKKLIDVSPVAFWSKIKEVCTMKSTKALCGLKFKDSSDLKFPRLNELYLKLFGNPYDIRGASLHNAKHDVSCLIMCARELVKRPEFSNLFI